MKSEFDIVDLIKRDRRNAISARMTQMKEVVTRQQAEPADKEKWTQAYILQEFSKEQLERIYQFLESFDH